MNKFAVTRFQTNRIKGSYDNTPYENTKFDKMRKYFNYSKNDNLTLKLSFKTKKIMGIVIIFYHKNMKIDKIKYILWNLFSFLQFLNFWKSK